MDVDRNTSGEHHIFKHWKRAKETSTDIPILQFAKLEQYQENNRLTTSPVREQLTGFFFQDFFTLRKAMEYIRGHHERWDWESAIQEKETWEITENLQPQGLSATVFLQKIPYEGTEGYLLRGIMKQQDANPFLAEEVIKENMPRTLISNIQRFTQRTGVQIKYSPKEDDPNFISIHLVKLEQIVRESLTQPGIFSQLNTTNFSANIESLVKNRQVLQRLALGSWNGFFLDMYFQVLQKNWQVKDDRLERSLSYQRRREQDTSLHPLFSIIFTLTHPDTVKHDFALTTREQNNTMIRGIERLKKGFEISNKSNLSGT